MIRFGEFKDIFAGTVLSEEELKRFYYSIKKSVILSFLGRQLWPELLKIEERCQWPVLKKIGDPGLSIYRGADKGLLEKFIKTISEEKQIRERKSSMDKGPYWIQLQSVIRERIELYTSIFGFCKKDVGHCEIVAERYAKIRDRRIRHRKRLWKIGIGTGAATLAGATALWYIAKKEKKQSDRDKPEKE